MNWSAFKDLVRVHLHAYNNTHGAQSLIEALIKGGVNDLQSAVKQLRVRTDHIPVATATTDGAAGKIDLIGGAFLTSVSARSVADSSIIRSYVAAPITLLPDAVEGNLAENARCYFYDSVAGTLWVHPLPSAEESEVVVTYHAISADYDDATEVSLGAGEAEAVAEYCLTKLCLNLDHDINMSSAHQKLYTTLKRQVMSDRNEAHVSTP